MEVVHKNITIHSREEMVELVFIADLHVASRTFVKDALLHAVDFIHKRKNCFWCGLGDLGECINYKDDRRFNQDSLRDRYAGRLHKLHQLERDELKGFFKSIAQQCIVLLDGNHESELKRRYGFDLTWDLINYFNADCGADTKWGDDAVYLRLSINRRWGNANSDKVYDFFLAHGYGGARTPAGKVNKVEEMRRIFPTADFFIMGHQHDASYRKPSALYINKGHDVCEKTQYLIGLPSFCKTYEKGSSGYASRKLYPPTSIGFTVIRLWPHANTPKVEVIL